MFTIPSHAMPLFYGEEQHEHSFWDFFSNLSRFSSMGKTMSHLVLNELSINDDKNDNSCNHSSHQDVHHECRA